MFQSMLAFRNSTEGLLGVIGAYPLAYLSYLDIEALSGCFTLEVVFFDSSGVIN
jgi:hypothetical protein